VYLAKKSIEVLQAPLLDAYPVSL